MLAPGALAVLQAISSYNSSMRSLEQNLAQAAQLSASEEVSMIAASREILTSLAAHPDVRAGTGIACRRALQRAIGGLDQYVGAFVVNAQGEFTCASDVDAHDRQRRRSSVVSGDHARRRLRDQRPPREPLARSLGHRHRCAARRRRRRDSGIDCALYRPRLADASLSAGRGERPGAFALLDSRGEIITADTERSPSPSPLPRKSLIDERLRTMTAGQTQTLRARGHDGVWRLYAISPLMGGRIFVMLGTPVLKAIGPLALQFAWGIFAPLLMWVLAIAVVWFGIEHLVVRWITYLERITSAYASGRHSVRPERVSAAPAEIRSLGETFSRMADLISAREAELRDSLEQKEILVREIHHRVKNNLQLVMSLLNLHARRIRDPRAELAFAEARSRINALATLHQAAVRIRKPAGSRPQVVSRRSLRRAAARRSVARAACRAERRLAERGHRTGNRRAARAAGHGGDHQRLQARVQ